jgi:hypothetical protein
MLIMSYLHRAGPSLCWKIQEFTGWEIFQRHTSKGLKDLTFQAVDEDFLLELQPKGIIS